MRAAKATLSPMSAEARAAWLYEVWYTPPDPPAPPPEPALFPEIGAKLSAAVPAATQWDSGWVVMQAQPNGSCVAAKGTLRRGLRPGQYVNLTRLAAPVSPGDTVAVTQLIDWVDAATGFWCMQSNPGEPAPPLARLYWSVDENNVFPVLSAVTALLTERRFTLKCPASTGGFGRVDSLVVYLEMADWPSLVEAVVATARTLAPRLRASWPPLTRPIARGVAFAQDPGTGESFGQHRCRLLAGALSDRLADAPQSDAVTAFAAALSNGGVNPDEPWRMS